MAIHTQLTGLYQSSGATLRYDQSSVDDLRAKTEIHEAWTNIALAGAHLSQGRFRDAGQALADAEFHYRLAQAYMTTPSAIAGQLAQLREKIDEMESAVHIKRRAAS